MQLRCINTGPVVNELGQINCAESLEAGRVYTLKSDILGGYELEEVETPPGHRGFAHVRFVRVSQPRAKNHSSTWQFINGLKSKV